MTSCWNDWAEYDTEDEDPYIDNRITLNNRLVTEDEAEHLAGEDSTQPPPSPVVTSDRST